MTEPLPLPLHLADFWSNCLAATPGLDASRLYDIFHFGDSQSLADELVDLVLQGTKRATTASTWSLEAEGKRLPRPGDLSIVTNFAGEPLCVIETLAVDVMPFAEVDAEFAAVEGEGDGSLAFWQDAHRRYFQRESAEAGRTFDERMPVACERFRVVFRPSTGGKPRS